MRDDTVLALMPAQALRGLAHYYDCTADILRRRADIFDPPPPPNRPSAVQIFFQIPDYVARMQHDGHTLEAAMAIVADKTGSTRERVELALKHRRKRERAELVDMRLQQSRAMAAAGASPADIAKALGCTERHARRLSAYHNPIEPEC